IGLETTGRLSHNRGTTYVRSEPDDLFGGSADDRRSLFRQGLLLGYMQQVRAGRWPWRRAKWRRTYRRLQPLRAYGKASQPDGKGSRVEDDAAASSQLGR